MKCPGQDMQFWNSDAIFDVDCPECGCPVEFYKDDTSRKCSGCGHRFVNPRMDFGCAAYCRFAEQCIGTLPEVLSGLQDNLLKEKVAVEIKRHYKTDYKKVRFIRRIAHYAEIVGKEERAEMPLLFCSSYLVDIEKEVPDSAVADLRQTAAHLAFVASLLEKIGARKQMINDVCHLLKGLGRTDRKPSLEAQILADAIWLARYEHVAEKDRPAARLTTAAGRRAAAR